MSTSSDSDDSTDSDNYTARQPATAMTAAAIQGARQTHKPGDDQRAPKFAVHPTGVLMHRSIVAGVLTNIDIKESDNGNKVAHVEITDQNGDTIYAYPTAEYNEKTFASLQVWAQENDDDESDFELPIWVVVVGKPSPFQSNEGDDWLVSFDIDSINHVNEAMANSIFTRGAENVAEMVDAYQEGAADGEAVADEVYDDRDASVQRLAESAHNLLDRTVGVNSTLPGDD
jgi:RPA family protein